MKSSGSVAALATPAPRRAVLAINTLQLYSGAIVPHMSSISHPLPDPLVDVIAQRFRVLGEPIRVKLLDRLREGDASIGELDAVLGDGGGR